MAISPLATATTPIRPFIEKATRVPSGDTAGSPTASLPKVRRLSRSLGRRRQ